MCRNIKPLLNFDPPATEEEIKNASIQFVRKISGFTKPSQINEAVFNQAVEKIAEDARYLLENLVTNSKPKDREVEKQKAKERNFKRFGS